MRYILVVICLSFLSCKQENKYDNKKIIELNNNYFRTQGTIHFLNLKSGNPDFHNLSKIYDKFVSMEKKIVTTPDFYNDLNSIVVDVKSEFDSVYHKENFQEIDDKLGLLNNSILSQELKENLFYLIRNDIFNLYLNNIIGPCYSEIHHRWLVFIENNCPKVNEKIELKISYGAIDFIDTYNIYIGGYKDGSYRSDLISDSLVAKDGYGIYDFVPKQTGDTIIEGVVEIKTRKGPKYYPFSKKITIFE